MWWVGRAVVQAEHLDRYTIAMAHVQVSPLMAAVTSVEDHRQMVDAAEADHSLLRVPIRAFDTALAVVVLHSPVEGLDSAISYLADTVDVPVHYSQAQD